MSQRGFWLPAFAAAAMLLGAADAPAQCKASAGSFDLMALFATGYKVIVGFPPYVSGACGINPASAVPWAHVTSRPDLDIDLSLDPNPYPAARFGTITHNGGSFTIGQLGRADCTYTISPEDPIAVSVDASPGSLTLTTNCGWSALADPWISVTPASGLPSLNSRGALGSYFGSTYASTRFTLAYTVQANSSPIPRTGTIRVGDKSLTISQPAFTCLPDVSPANATIPAEGVSGTFSVSVNKRCSWSAQSFATWIQATSSGFGDGKVSYTVLPNVPGAQRTSSIVVGGRSFVLTQQGFTCSIQVAPGRLSVAAGAGSAVLSLTANSQLCPWEATTDVPWIGTGTPAKGAGNAKHTLTFAANPGTEPRTGTVTIGGQSISVTQAGAAPVVTVTSIRHAATRQSGPVAPGQLVIVQGQGIGPATDLHSDWTQDGKLPLLLGGTRVTFNDVAAPLINVGPKEVAVVVPYGIPETGSVKVVVEHERVASAPTSISTQPAVPGIFTADSSGQGPALAFNPDGQANSRDIPAPRASVIVMFATGAGRQQPDVDDGSKSSATSTLRLPVSVTIGGIPARIVYAGDLPGAVTGMLQVNVEVPADTVPGNAEVVLRVGDWASPAGTTISVSDKVTP